LARSDPLNRSRYWWDRSTPGLSLLTADFTTHEYPPHSHEAFVVAVTETGGSVIKSRGRIEEAHESTLFVFNPAEPHAGWMGRSRRWRYRSFYLTASGIEGLARALDVERVPHFRENRVEDPDLVRRFLTLHRGMDEGRDSLFGAQGLTDAFGRLFRRHGDGGDRIETADRGDGRLGRVVELMRGRSAESLRLDELAAEAGLSAFQLIGLFKRSVGLTPHAYLTQLRLGHACRLLRHGQPIAEAALAAGFYDQSALTKHFKRCYGITPLQFAAAASAGAHRSVGRGAAGPR
jgi:AraC-like DNA-binding protein